MKRITSILIIIIITCSTIIPAFAETLPVDAAVKIHDGAALLSESELAGLEEQAQAIVTRTGMDIAVVTINDLDGLTAKAYADDLYDYGGFGIGTGRDGLLLLVDMGSRSFHVTTTGAAIAAFHEQDLEELFDSFQPDLSAGNYHTAFTLFLAGSETYIDGFNRQRIASAFGQMTKITASTQATSAQLVDPSVKIHDGAGILTDSEIAKLEQQAQDIIKLTNVDIAVVTVYGLNGLSAKAYSNDVFVYSGFGVGENYDGLLLLIDLEERDYYITTGGSAIEHFTDRELDAIISKFLPDLKSGNYYSAFSTFLSESRGHLANQLGLPLRQRTSVAAILGVSLVIGLAVSGITMAVIVMLHKRSLSKAPDAAGYLASDGFVVTRRTDHFLHTHTSRRAIPKSTSSSGGGRGGSSTGSHSSGRSLGGRGGKF